MKRRISFQEEPEPAEQHPTSPSSPRLQPQQQIASEEFKWCGETTQLSKRQKLEHHFPPGSRSEENLHNPHEMQNLNNFSDTSSLFLQLPIELFEKVLSFLEQGFLLDSFFKINQLTHSIIHHELIWRNRSLVIDKKTSQLPVHALKLMSHVQICAKPNFSLYHHFFHSNNLTVLELSHTRIKLEHLVMILFSNRHLVNVSLCQLEVYDIDPLTIPHLFSFGGEGENENENGENDVNDVNDIGSKNVVQEHEGEEGQTLVGTSHGSGSSSHDQNDDSGKMMKEKWMIENVDDEYVNVDNDEESEDDQRLHVLKSCVSLRWIHVHFGTVQISNQIMSEILKRCPRLETIQFATQNCANFETAKIVFSQPNLRNLSLFGMDELTLDEFFELYVQKPQWNSINLQSCGGICNFDLLHRICKLSNSSHLKELTLRFEPAVTNAPPLLFYHHHNQHHQHHYNVGHHYNDQYQQFWQNQFVLSPDMCSHLQVLRLNNIDPMVMTPLITNIVNNCAKSLQILSLHIPSDYEDWTYRHGYQLKKAFQFFPGKQYTNLKQISISNLPFSVCSQFEACSPNLEKIVVFGTGEHMDGYFRSTPRIMWNSLKVLFLENVSFNKTRKLTSLIFSLPNLEVLKFACVFCESSTSGEKALSKMVPLSQISTGRRTRIVDLEIHDSCLTSEFFIQLFASSPDLKHLKLSDMESDHIVPAIQKGYGKFYESLSSMCPNLLTLHLQMRSCPCLKDMLRAYELTKIQRMSILDIMKLRFDEAFSFILSLTNAQTVQLFIDPTQMMEGSFYFFKDFRSFYEHLLLEKKETVDYFQIGGNFGSFVFQILKERLEYALYGVKFRKQDRTRRCTELQAAFTSFETLRKVPCLWQFYLFCGMSLALINPTLRKCCERDLNIQMDQFNWSVEQQ